MPKIYQFIRKRLIQEGKPGRYLLYAVGEIVLIIVGILLAFQINQWNEERKSESRYQAYVEQLKVDVLTAIETTEGTVEYSKESFEWMRLLLDYFYEAIEAEFTDEEIIDAYQRAGRYGILPIFVGNLGELLSGNFDTISRNQTFTIRAQELQRQLTILLEVAERMTRRIEEGQTVLRRLRSKEVLKTYPQRKGGLMLEIDALGESQEFKETIFQLSTAYATYRKFSEDIAAELETFLTDIDRLK